MQDLPRQVLRLIVEKEGQAIVYDPRRLEGLLRDHCGEFKREIFILVSAAKQRVPEDLISGNQTLPYEALVERLKKRLVDNLAMDDEAATWGIQSWASVLDILPQTYSLAPQTAPTVLRPPVPTPKKTPSLPMPQWAFPKFNWIWLVVVLGISLILVGGFYTTRRAVSSTSSPTPEATLSRDSYNQGLAYVEKGDYAQAINAFSSAIKTDPSFAAAYTARGKAFFSQGNYSQAIADSQNAITMTPDDAGAYFTLGLAHEAQGDHTSAIVAYNKAIEIIPGDANLYYARGLANQAGGIFGQAVVDFSKVIELTPTNADAYFQRGQSRAALNNLEGAIADYTKTLDLTPDEAEPYFYRGQVLAREGNWTGAITDFTKAIQLDPLNAVVYYQRGLARSEQSDRQGAIADYTQAINLDPNMKEVYYQRAVALTEKGDLEAAMQDYAKAIQLDPTNAGVYYNRGLARADKGDLYGAIADFTKAIEIAPDNAGFYYNRGLVWAKIGGLEAAVEDFTQAIERDNTGNISYNAYINRAYVYTRQRNHESAVNDAKRATQLQPDDPQSWNSLCWLGSLAGRASEVLSACQQAVKLAPDNGNIRDSRGLAFSLTGDYQGAIEDFTAFIAWSQTRHHPEQERILRETWIKTLRSDKNPIDQTTLESLMDLGATSSGTATPTLPTPTP